jgi:exodeoxyribonuclease VII small subunit
MMNESTHIQELTFEAGYERLQAISARLNDDEVPVSEMCDLFAEGKGLEQALTTYLETQRERVEAIERGEGVRAFRIARTSSSEVTGSGRLDPGHAASREALPTLHNGDFRF